MLLTEKEVEQRIRDMIPSLYASVDAVCSEAATERIVVSCLIHIRACQSLLLTLDDDSLLLSMMWKVILEMV